MITKYSIYVRNPFEKKHALLQSEVLKRKLGCSTYNWKHLCVCINKADMIFAYH